MKTSAYASFNLVFELLKVLRKSLISIGLTIAAIMARQIIKITAFQLARFSGHRLLTSHPQLSSLISSLPCLLCFVLIEHLEVIALL